MNVPKLRFKEFSGVWKENNIKGISTKITDGTHDTPKPAESGIPYLTAIHIKDGYLDFPNCYYLPEEEHNKIYKRCNPEFGDLLLVNIGAGTGTVSMVKVNFEFSLKNVALIKPNRDIIKPEFLYQIQHMNCKKLNHKLTSGGAQPFLSLKEIAKIKLNLPLKQEQEKIASFLTSVDTKIEQLTKKEELLQQYKKGVMQKIFNYENRKAKDNCSSLVDSEPKAMCESTAGGIRFKADDGSEFCDWEEKKVKDIFDITRGNVLSMTLVTEKKDNYNIYPVYSSQTKNKGLSGYFDKFLFENCITWTTDGAGAGDVNYRDGKFYCTNVCGVLKSNQGYANQFIAELLNTISRKYVSYVGNPKLMNNVMAEIKIFIPKEIQEQTKISNFLSSIDTKIEQVQKQLDFTKEFKKALLQQMFV